MPVIILCATAEQRIKEEVLNIGANDNVGHLVSVSWLDREFANRK